jgi:chromosome segregation ATPase
MSAALTEDGSLDVHVSREKRLADASMLTFIKQHMSEILRPFAEHMDQLHSQADLLSDDLEVTKLVAQTAVEKNAAQGKLIQGLRDDMTENQRQAAATKTALHQTTAEGLTLRLEYDATKVDVAGMNKRFMDTIPRIDHLQRGHDKTDKTLAEISFRLQETREHLKNSIEVQIENQGKDLQNLDAAQQATAQLLAATKRFTDDFHDEFTMSTQRQDGMHASSADHFARLENRLGHLSTMLTETVNRLNTHANHLRSTNVAVRSMGEKQDPLVDSHHKLRLQVKEMNEYLVTLREHSSASREMVRELNGQLCEVEMGKQAMKAGLQDSVGQLSTGLTSVQETLKYHTKDLLPTQNKRMLRLEMYNARLLHEVKQLHEQMGTQPTQPMADIMAEASPSEMPGISDLPQMPQVTQEVTQAGTHAPALSGAAGALMGVGMRARLDKCNRKLEDHDHDIATAKQKLQEAQDDLKVKTKRIENLEKTLESLGKSVSETKDGLELTEEWWKGLSHGFREAHRQVSIEKELLPPTRPGTAFSMATTQSGGPSQPPSRPQSRNQSRQSRPQSARSDNRNGRIPHIFECTR